jgi:hypothetical protein
MSKRRLTVDAAIDCHARHPRRPVIQADFLPAATAFSLAVIYPKDYLARIARRTPS